MTTQHPCPDCGDIYPSLWASMLCCDPAAPGDND